MVSFFRKKKLATKAEPSKQQVKEQGAASPEQQGDSSNSNAVTKNPLPKRSSWLGGNNRSISSAGSAASSSSFSNGASPSLAPPSQLTKANSTGTINDNRTRRKNPKEGTGGGSGALWNRSTSRRTSSASVSKLPTVNEEGVKKSPSRSWAARARRISTPETMDTTVTSTHEEDGDWIIEPVVAAAGDCSVEHGQVEVLTLATKQQRDHESLKKQLFQQEQQQEEHEPAHTVTSVPMSSPDADGISKAERSVSPLTITTGEKLAAAVGATASNKKQNTTNQSGPRRASTTPLESSSSNNASTSEKAKNLHARSPATGTASASTTRTAERNQNCGLTEATSLEDNVTVTVESIDDQENRVASTASPEEDHSTIPTTTAGDGTTTLDSAAHSSAMRGASSGVESGTTFASGTFASTGSGSHYSSGSHHEQQHQDDRFIKAAADKLACAFNCAPQRPQELIEQPLGVMAIFYDKLCSPDDVQRNLCYGEREDEKDAKRAAGGMLNDTQKDGSTLTARKKPFFNEAFAVMFIKRMISEGISMLYLQSPGAAGNENSEEWKGKSVTMMIAPGCTGEAEMVQPKLEWTTMPGGLSQDMVTVSLPLLNIHSIITRAHDSLGDDLEMELDDMCFLTITSRQGDVHVFEANTPDQRDAIADGLQNTISRLAFHLVTGDSRASTELYNDDRMVNNTSQGEQQDAGDLPALPNPRLNMNRIAHMMLDY